MRCFPAWSATRRATRGRTCTAASPNAPTGPIGNGIRSFESDAGGIMRALFLGALLLFVPSMSDARPRAREAGIGIGILPPGPLNAITDVTGVEVGHVTLVGGETIRTGVTAILPHGGNLYQDTVPAGFAVANGYGKFMGSTQIKELGEIETPILITNTMYVPKEAAGITSGTNSQPGNEEI